jgi:hypothetical protein
MTMVLRRAARLNEAAVTPLDPVGLSLLVHRALFGDVAPGDDTAVGLSEPAL